MICTAEKVREIKPQNVRTAQQKQQFLPLIFLSCFSNMGDQTGFLCKQCKEQCLNSSKKNVLSTSWLPKSMLAVSLSHFSSQCIQMQVVCHAWHYVKDRLVGLATQMYTSLWIYLILLRLQSLHPFGFFESFKI